ncbi:hypothetical protein [Mycobacterium simiae]|uniref:hypothetical protein n=1 Tax=Mycobacterium simiae TaxID=1784 RepID=UPI002639EE08|nr:hypothetical protein [Mycobacterium simiae]
MTRIKDWLRSQGVWFWAITATIVSVAVLFFGSQIAHDRGQTAEWYTGFGQWLGALGSLIAAAVALWIAVTDRRYVEKQLDADLAREAALVRVQTGLFNQGIGPRYAGIRINNRRTGRIFEIKVVKYVMDGKEISPLILASIGLFPAKDSHYAVKELEYLSVANEQSLYLFPNELPNVPADYVAVAYTDPSGRRWKVDTNHTAERL